MSRKPSCHWRPDLGRIGRAVGNNAPRGQSFDVDVEISNFNLQVGFTRFTARAHGDDAIRIIGGTTPSSDPFADYVNLGIGTALQRDTDLDSYTENLFAGGSSQTGENHVLRSLALAETRLKLALRDSAGNQLPNLDENLALVIEDAFEGRAHSHFADSTRPDVHWDSSKQTVVLVHGIRTDHQDSFLEGSRLQAALGSKVNVISYYWGRASLENGQDRQLTLQRSGDISTETVSSLRPDRMTGV